MYWGFGQNDVVEANLDSEMPYRVHQSSAISMTNVAPLFGVEQSGPHYCCVIGQKNNVKIVWVRILIYCVCPTKDGFVILEWARAKVDGLFPRQVLVVWKLGWFD